MAMAPTIEIKASLLTQLEREHRKVEKLFAKLEKAKDAEAQAALVDELAMALMRHMETEETQVYPALTQLDAEMGEEAQVEHGLGRDGIDTMRGLIGEPGFGAAVAMAKAGIAHHVEEEEKEAFPKLRKAMGVKTTARRPAPTTTARRRTKR